MIDNWGWTSYKKLNWIDNEGRKYYMANFTLSNDDTFEQQKRICFWAHKPGKALDEICLSGKEPITFYDKRVN